MDGIIEDVKLLFNQVMSKIKGGIVRDLQGFGRLSPEQISIIEAHMDKSLNPFERLETHYLQDKYYKEHLDYLVGYTHLFVFDCVHFVFISIGTS